MKQTTKSPLMLIINYQHMDHYVFTDYACIFCLRIRNRFNKVVDKIVLAVIYSDIGQDLQFAYGTCLMIPIDMK
jgi:hypothetical protein